MSKPSNPPRRQFLGAAATTFAAATLGALASAHGEPREPRRLARADGPAARPRSNAAFVSIKQIDAGLLNVGYAEAGPAKGPAVVLLHGWPYDIHAFVDVVPILAAAGFRVIVPSLRGHGTTRFLSNDTVRMPSSPRSRSTSSRSWTR